MLHHGFRIILALLLLAAACDKKTETTPQTTPEVPEAPEPEPVKEEAPPTPVELDPPLAIPEVRAVFNRWLAAQNEGDFETYIAQYAPRFEGIKRIGPRTYRFDREGWAQDRERMFKKKMKVEAKDVVVATSSTTAMLRFQQTWESGKFKDVGPKQLLFVKTPQGLRISREEMLESNVEGTAAGEPSPYDPQVFAMVVDGAVVLDTAPRQNWFVGEPKLRERPKSATREVDLPSTGFAPWIGRELELFDAQKQVCTAKIESINALARTVLHFGTVEMLEGIATYEKEGPRSDGYVAQSIWWHATRPVGNGVDLVGWLAKNPKCEGAIWARPKGSKATPLPAQTLQGPELRNVVAAFTDLPGYHEVQTDYDASGLRGAWHEDESATAEFRQFGDWVVASARAGAGCGGFGGAFWGIWGSTAQGGLVLQSDEKAPAVYDFHPKAALQVGEKVYFLDDERVVGDMNGTWEVLFDTEPPDWDCPC